MLRSHLKFEISIFQFSISKHLIPDKRSPRHPALHVFVAQCQLDRSAGQPGMFTGDEFGPSALTALYCFDNRVVLIVAEFHDAGSVG